jgi:Na+/proline symporter
MQVVVEIALEKDAEAGGRITNTLLTLVPGLGADAGAADAAWLIIVMLYVFTGAYATLAGLWGVMVVDLYQFLIAIGMAIVLAVIAVNTLGGFDGMQSSLVERYGEEQAALYTNALPRPTDPPEYTQAQLDALGWDAPPSALASQFIFPVKPEGVEIDLPDTGGVGKSVFFAFLVFIGITWWSVWYPGHEPGGGGYIAQRILSAKDEKNSLFATLLFSICHFALRPWPWVIVGLFCLVQYPGNEAYEENANSGYALAMFDLLRPGLLGLMLVSFLAAFMSTISTQINWGSSYIVNDFYQRFISPHASQRHLIIVSRVSTVLLVLLGLVVSSFMTTVEKAWLVVMGLGAGTGLVYMLRWFWWRINAWTEIAAMTTSLIVWVALSLLNTFYFGPKLHWQMNEQAQILITVLASIAVWLPITFMTRPTDRAKLREFYRVARPGGPGWQSVAAEVDGVKVTDKLGLDIINWILGCAMIYGVLFGTWKLMLGQMAQASGLIAVAAVSIILIVVNLSRTDFKEFGK